MTVGLKEPRRWRLLICRVAVVKRARGFTVIKGKCCTFCEGSAMAAAMRSLVLLSLVVAINIHLIQSQLGVIKDSYDTNRILRDEAIVRLNQLGKISDSEDFLQRTFLSPAALQAAKLIQDWMQDAGLYTWVDEIGNVHGRWDGVNASAPALLIGSHLDTVIDAGKYDGALGIVSAIAAVKSLQRNGKLMNFPRPIELIAFSDEEGVRFQSTFLGSAAIAGVLLPELLFVKDKRGVTLESALKSCSLKGTKDSLHQLKYDPDSVWGYIEVHIEQGPVLEAQEIPLGVVEAIAGQTRLRVKLQGSQGHAGTVPMAMRRDPMPAAAQAIVSIEKLCIGTPALEITDGGGLVCTVGEISSWPGASNVIPGEVIFTVDVRAKEDAIREQTVFGIETSIRNVCRDRGLSCNVHKMHEAKAVNCDKGLIHGLKKAAELTMLDLKLSETPVQGKRGSNLVPSLMSGAGHDAMAMAHLTKVGMLFVRCTGGISHSPAENVLEEDVLASGLSILHFLNNHFEPEHHLA